MSDKASRLHLYLQQICTATPLLLGAGSLWGTDVEEQSHLLFRGTPAQSFYLQCKQSREYQKEEGQVESL